MIEKFTPFFSTFPDTLTTLAVLVAGLVAQFVVFTLLRAYDRREDSALTHSVCSNLKIVSSWFFPVLVISLLLPLVPLLPKPFEVLRRVVKLTLILPFAWGLIRTLDVIQDFKQEH